MSERKRRNSIYEDDLSKVVSSLNSYLDTGLITREEFDILLGSFLKRRINAQIQQDIQDLVPELKESERRTTLFGYEWRKVLSHGE